MYEADEPMKGAVCMDKGTKTTALRPRVQGEVAAEFAEILPAVERWHQMAIQHARIAVWAAACCGQALIERKKAIGHGGWMKFLKVLPFGYDTASKYMDLAEEWRTRTGQIPTTIGISSENRAKLLTGEVMNLDAADIAQITEEVVGQVGETSLRQLYFDWGICKPPYKPGGNMRKPGGTPNTLTPEEIQLAVACEWVRMLNELTEQARRRKSHIHLDDAEIKSHRDGLMYVMGELDAEIARRAKKGAR
jgi:hypothetical protein